jgi:Protein of unknown function (DUF4019)
MRVERIPLVICLSVFLIVSAVANDEALPGLGAIRQWLVNLDGGEYERCWVEGAKLLHDVQSLDKWTDFQKKQSQLFGKCTNREMIGTAAHNRFLRADGTTIEAEFLEAKFKSAFESRPLVVESISAIKEADGKWRVFAYDARPFARE